MLSAWLNPTLPRQPSHQPPGPAGRTHPARPCHTCKAHTKTYFYTQLPLTITHADSLPPFHAVTLIVPPTPPRTRAPPTRAHAPATSLPHPTEFCEKLLQDAGPRFAGPIAILRNWTYCLFYVMAELWGSVVVSVLFWGFANQITTVDEASQFYPLVRAHAVACHLGGGVQGGAASPLGACLY